MEKLRQFFQEKFILSAVMCVLLAVVLVTATYGWYAINNSTKAYGIDLKTGGIGGIKVATVAGGPDIMSDDSLSRNPDGIPVISINLKDFENIEEGKVAPGAYGPMPFYITALAENVKSYSIKVQLEYRPSEKVQVTEDEKKEIEAMINDHITVYCNKITASDGSARFEEPLTYYTKATEDGTAATGALQYNVEVLAQLYWVWNYELTDIPNYQSISRFPTYSNTDTATVRSAVRQYDEEDTVLGNYIEDIWFNVYIEGRLEGENG